MSEITLAVGDGARRMTYAELAQARGISLPAARRLTLRHHWPKQTGNDGLVRVSVPLLALGKPRKTAINADPASPSIDSVSDSKTDPGSDAKTDGVSDTTRAILVLESAVEGLCEQLVIANQRADRAEQQVATLRTELAEARVADAQERRRLLMLLTDQPRPWWRRWFR